MTNICYVSRPTPDGCSVWGEVPRPRAASRRTRGAPLPRRAGRVRRARGVARVVHRIRDMITKEQAADMANVAPIEDLLEELNDSDVTSNLRDLERNISTLGSAETSADFVAELSDAIEQASELLKNLRALKTAVAS